MDLVGPDGKSLKPEEPARRAMPSRQEKFNLVMMMFTLMTREERQMLIKMLRLLRQKLDVLYPNGMKEGDIKNDLEKAAASVVPDEPANAVAQESENGTVESVSEQSKSNTPVEEGPTYESIADDARGF